MAKRVLLIVSVDLFTLQSPMYARYSGTLSQAQITSGWKSSAPNKVGEYYRDIELISAQELKGKFEQNGGNHD